jgi:hypothetical protein
LRAQARQRSQAPGRLTSNSPFPFANLGGVPGIRAATSKIDPKDTKADADLAPPN